MSELQTQAPRELAPLLRWVGGKRALAPIIGPKILEALASGGRYFEPFLGSAAIYLWLVAQGWRGRAVLSDACAALIQTYRAIWSQADLVSGLLDVFEELEREAQDHKAYYLAIRKDFNAGGASSAVQAARMLWLNRRCFNGLWRQGPGGEFNVAWGGERKTPMPTDDELQGFAAAIKWADLRTCSFEVPISEAGAGDVIYADSPYNGDYAGYSARFGPREHGELAACLKQAVERGATVFASNANTPYVRAVYSGWAEIEEIPVVYKVGGKGERREETSEVLITARPR